MWRLWLLNVSIRGLVGLRTCITNHRTTDDDVRAVAEQVLAAAEETAWPRPRQPPPRFESTTDKTFLGARFWGQGRGFSAASGETGRIAGKALNQALFRDHIAAERSLHGKEAVDGSSPADCLKYLQIRMVCFLARHGPRSLVMEGVSEVWICRQLLCAKRRIGGRRGL